MKKVMLKTTISLAVAMASTQIFASGFAINEQSISGMGTGFAGRYFGSKSEVKIVTLQPTVSYAFNDKVSIGFGPTINRIDGTLESNLSITQAAPDGKVKIEGDDTALGYNIGVLVQATDRTRV